MGRLLIDTDTIYRDKFTFDIMDALKSPVLTFSTEWADAIPQRLLDLVTQSRLISNITGDRMAGLPETIAYIMTRTLLSPMDHEWTNIYCHISCEVAEHHWNKDCWQEIFGNDRRDLTNYETDLLNELRRWIYKKRREVLSDRLKEERRREMKEKRNPEPEEPVIKEMPLNLWNFAS